MPVSPDRVRRAAVALAACASVVLVAGCASAPSQTARRSLVDAERAFASMATERGIRAAFIDNFADDGVGFNPAPYRLREAWSGRPLPADPKALTLAWHPVIAGVARSGALGFTAGPSLFVDTTGSRPAVQGVYFSMWRRDAAGRWKVVADAGIETPRALVDADFGADPIVSAPPPFVAAVPTLDAADAGASGTVAAFAAALAEDARWHVDGRVPIFGRVAIVAAWSGDARALRFVTQGREAATTGDLGYTFGAIQSEGTPAGHYLHMWTRGGDGAWRLSVAVHLP